MDPFTIVGTTAAILQLSQFAGAIIQTAYGIYTSASDQTAANESIENVFSKLASLLADCQNVILPREHQNQGFAELIEHCQTLVGKLLDLLNRAKAKKAHSLRESLKAGFKTHWNKSDVEVLRKELESCQSLLGLYLMHHIRSESHGNLEKILNENSAQKQELTLLREAVEKVEKGQALGYDSVRRLWELLSFSESCQQDLNRKRILNSLAFPGMGTRYKMVARSSKDTFNWCLKDAEIPESHPELEIPFQRWLSEGQGIFHISGKPGAGKSTLMKFIVDNPNTKMYLEQWAKTRSQTLEVASFFFWKPATDYLEKNLEGLLRSMLHKICSAEPKLAPLIFPQHWKPSEERPFRATDDLEIPFKDLFTAFETLTGSMDIMRNHCFCFFIDGLDEFEDYSEGHIDLIKHLKRWTQGEFANVKICVSSREHNSFMKKFPAGQRLRLHFLTVDDITKTIDTSLSKYDEFLENTLEDRQRFVKEVVQRSEGVYLWVKLVLHKLGEDLEAGDSLDDLRNTLNNVPEKLEGLFSDLLGSIDRPNQGEAWTIVAVLMAVDGFKMEFLCTLHYSFVKDFMKNHKFAQEMPVAYLTNDQILDRQKRFKLRLNHLLKGLVEVDHSRDDISNDNTSYNKYQYLKEKSSCGSFKGSLIVTHRSVYEFLKSDCPEMTKTFMDSLNVRSIVLQCIMAHIKHVKWDLYMYQMMCSLLLSPHGFTSWLQGSSSEKNFEEMGCLDDLLLKLQRGESASTRIDWLVARSFPILLYSKIKEPKRFPVLLLASSFFFGFTGYVRWARKNRTRFFSQDRTRVELFICLLDGVLEQAIEEPLELLRQLSEDGFITSEMLAFPISSITGSPWQFFASRTSANIIFHTWIHGIPRIMFEALNILLRFQVDVRLQFSIVMGSEKEPGLQEDYSSSKRVIVNVQARYNTGFKFLHRSAFIMNGWGQLKPVMTFRDIIKLLDPKMNQELLRLVDHNLARYESPTTPVQAITEIEDFKGADVHGTRPPDTETGNSVEGSGLETTGHGWSTHWEYIGNLPHLLLLAGFGGILVAFLVVVTVGSWRGT